MTRAGGSGGDSGGVAGGGAGGGESSAGDSRAGSSKRTTAPSMSLPGRMMGVSDVWAYSRSGESRGESVAVMGAESELKKSIGSVPEHAAELVVRLRFSATSPHSPGV